MRSRLSFWATLLLGTALLGSAACGTPDLIVTAAGLPAETRWLDVILWQFRPDGVTQQVASSRQLVDIADRGGSNFYRVGLLNLDREPTYAIFAAAFRDDGHGIPCLINTAAALQDPGWSLVGDILVPFFDDSILPATRCFAPPSPSPSWPTERPFIASVSLATTAFADKNPATIPSLKVRGWNFMRQDSTQLSFVKPPTPLPKMQGKVSSPLLIEWSVEQTPGVRLVIQDMTVERADKSASHTVTLDVEIPSPF